jgi:hypothetical protein
MCNVMADIKQMSDVNNIFSENRQTHTHRVMSDIFPYRFASKDAAAVRICVSDTSAIQRQRIKTSADSEKKIG